mmetsp:Transcript_38637/g.111533  ORF Transcript_38637/g.111533 Transcript_38637/m.111533 type:complete len:492 (+) Transcript_38637:448-1923(+)
MPPSPSSSLSSALMPRRLPESRRLPFRTAAAADEAKAHATPRVNEAGEDAGTTDIAASADSRGRGDAGGVPADGRPCRRGGMAGDAGAAPAQRCPTSGGGRPRPSSGFTDHEQRGCSKAGRSAAGWARKSCTNMRLSSTRRVVEGTRSLRTTRDSPPMQTSISTCKCGSGTKIKCAPSSIPNRESRALLLQGVKWPRMRAKFRNLGPSRPKSAHATCPTAKTLLVRNRWATSERRSADAPMARSRTSAMVSELKHDTTCSAPQSALAAPPEAEVMGVEDVDDEELEIEAPAPAAECVGGAQRPKMETESCIGTDTSAETTTPSANWPQGRSVSRPMQVLPTKRANELWSATPSFAATASCSAAALPTAGASRGMSKASPFCAASVISVRTSSVQPSLKPRASRLSGKSSAVKLLASGASKDNCIPAGATPETACTDHKRSPRRSCGLNIMSRSRGPRTERGKTKVKELVPRAPRWPIPSRRTNMKAPPTAR